ncbi:cytochrome P450, partial [Lepidopterella palustris CBS 459.81]
SISIYRRFFHRCSKFPGPFWASLTKFWALFTVRGGEYHRTVRRLHQKHGDFVRVGPREIDICNVEAIPTIYGLGTKCIKGPWYEGTLMGGHERFLQNEKPDAHMWKRRIWDAGFNSKSIREYEPHVLRIKDDLLDQLEHVRKEKGVVDLGLYFSFFTWDIMGDLGFGESFHMLKSGTQNNAMTIVQGFAQFNALICTIPWCATLFAWLPKAKLAEDLFTFAKERVKERLPLGKSRADIFTHLLAEDRVSKKKYNNLELILETFLTVLIGSDTTSSSLATICYYLIAHPEKYDKLKTEIHTFDGALTHINTAKLPYLNAVIREALRLLPPIGSGMMHRETPPEGIDVDGTHIPGNTTVGVGAFEIQRDPRYYGQPDDFIPERWLGEGPEPFDRNAFMVFSYGPYSCVGKHLAYLELCDVIAAVVKAFDMEFAPGYDPSTYETSIKDSVISTRAYLPVILTPR